MSRFIQVTCAVASLAFCTPVHAEVTANDVWENIEAYLDTFGGAPEVAIKVENDGLDVREIKMSWDLPRDSGTLTMVQSGFALVEKADGTVDVQYPATQSVTFRADITGEGTYAGTIDLMPANMKITASGTPGNIDYTYSADQVDFALRDVEFADQPAPDVMVKGFGKDLSGTAKIRADDMLTVSGNLSLGENQVDVNSQTDARGKSTFASTAAGLSASHETVLPRDGIEIFNLADAMQRGLKISGESTLQDYSSEQVLTLDGALISQQLTQSDAYQTSFALDKDTALIDVAMDNTRFSFNAPDAIPFPISGIIARNSVHARLPVAASDQIQKAQLSFDLTGLELPEHLWGMIDPTAGLPREPMALQLDLGAEIKSFWNWFDFADVARRGDAGEQPGELHGLDVNALNLRAAGAELSGTGQASFDNSDTETYRGFPKPTGALDLTLKGGNALLDKLVEIGLLPEQQATLARMMIGTFAKPDEEAGTDVLRSHLEFTDDGALLANGMRIR